MIPISRNPFKLKINKKLKLNNDFYICIILINLINIHKIIIPNIKNLIPHDELLLPFVNLNYPLLRIIGMIILIIILIILHLIFVFIFQ